MPYVRPSSRTSNSLSKQLLPAERARASLSCFSFPRGAGTAPIDCAWHSPWPSRVRRVRACVRRQVRPPGGTGRACAAGPASQKDRRERARRAQSPNTHKHTCGGRVVWVWWTLFACLPARDTTTTTLHGRRASCCGHCDTNRTQPGTRTSQSYCYHVQRERDPERTRRNRTGTGMVWNRCKTRKRAEWGVQVAAECRVGLRRT